jgi:hypothetical protein
MTASPLTLTAIQNAPEQEIPLAEAKPVLRGAVQTEPFHVKARPLLSTAMQNFEEPHPMAVNFP